MQPIHRNYSHQQPVTPIKTPLHKQRRVQYGTVAVCALFICVFTFNSLFGGKKDSSDGKVLASSVEKSNDEQSSTSPKRTVDLSNLQASLDPILKKYPKDDTSVSVIEVNSGKLVQAGDTYPFVAASTAKVLTALLFFNNVENGQESLNTNFGDTTAKQLLQKMITDSDNDAWKTLNDSLTHESLAAYAKKQGLTSYDVEKNMMTSNDMALLMQKLYTGQLINQDHLKLLLSWMQNTSEERFIPSAVPQGIKVYHKAGYLNDRVHDAAIVDNGSTPFIIVIYSKAYGTADYDYDAGQKLYAEIVTQALQTFQ